MPWSADGDGAVDRHGLRNRSTTGQCSSTAAASCWWRSGFRAGDADLHADSREPGPHAVVEAEEAADVEVAVNGDGQRVERDALRETVPRGDEQSVLPGEPLPCGLLRHAERFADAGPADAPGAQDGHVVVHGRVGLGDRGLNLRQAGQHLIVGLFVP
jgi:hypothetical protein